MTEKKPSKAQRKVLEGLAAGSWLECGDNSFTWMLAGEVMNHRTIKCLYQEGWISWLSEPRFHYRITDLGRSVLKEKDNG